MIVNIIMALLYGVIRVVLLPFTIGPVAVFPDFITTPFAAVSSYVMVLDFIVPAALLTSLLAYSVIFEGGYFVFKGIYWIIRRLPTQS
jgi:hypothetical protein